MSFRVTRHGGLVCGCKHIQGFHRYGPSAKMEKRDPSLFYQRDLHGEVTRALLPGYTNDLFVGNTSDNKWPEETGEERLKRIVLRLKQSWRGHRIEAVLKAGRYPEDTEKMTPKQITERWGASGQILWEPLLLELGFIRVGPQFYNSNSGNWLRTYHLFITPEMHAEASGSKSASKPSFR